MQSVEDNIEVLNQVERYINLLGLPKKTLKRLYGYLNPADCYNLAKCSKNLENQVKKHKHLKINQICLRYDDEKSCIGAYFDKYKNVACVFYSWRIPDGNQTIWNNTYPLRPHKLYNYLFCKKTHPKEVAALQSDTRSVNFFEGMMETYKDLCNFFSAHEALHYVGVNVNDKKSCAAFSSQSLRRQIYGLRLIGTKPPKPHRVKNVIQAANVAGTIRVSHAIGPACMQEQLINAYHVVLDDPEWITREELLSLNCVSAEIGHNYLTADDLNAFIMQWMFLDSDQVQTERLEITLSPEAFKNKKTITNGLMLHDWDPKRREGEYFDALPYLSKHSLRDPNHYLDCKYSKDIIREDGRLATIHFFAKKLFFIVWQDHFPYRTLKLARLRQQERDFEYFLNKALTDALRVIEVRAQEEWNKKTEWLEAVVTSRKVAAEEEQSAKRKYFQALQEFLDTSEPKPKRRLLRTITIFKNDNIP